MDMKLDELKIIADAHGFNVQFIEKDFLLTYLLYLIKDVKGIYFKGGTALNKIILSHQRISEDLDFTLDRNLNDVEKDIRSKLSGTIFKSITHDKRVDRFYALRKKQGVSQHPEAFIYVPHYVKCGIVRRLQGKCIVHLPHRGVKYA